ncbi:MAG: DegT/DnrJ/EryC1/StrS aminotransferase family protein [Campylobacteraceae bacterium]|jgi:dTDP-4-amino-4,6-dideoxygalactose transaminase|nr:DegT/DnrJ/EryC1/StrS aminotransferase family protein [Campylobacteraceae bacterium]
MKEIPFYRPLIDELEFTHIHDVLEGNKPSKIDQFETNAMKFLGAKHAIATYNGTAAMHLAMCAMDMKRGDKFICSVNSAPTVAEVVRHFDAEPILVDIDADDFNIDIKKLEQTLEKEAHKKLKGIFVSHVGGQPSDMDPIYELAKKYNVQIVDDAITAFGASYKGKKIGALDSAISCFRFSPQLRYNIAGCGIMTMNDTELYERAKLLINHAIVSNGWDKFGNLGYIYDVVDIGVKYDIHEVNAAFVLAQLAKMDRIIARQKKIAAIYDKAFENCRNIKTPVVKRDHIYTYYIVKIDKNRDKFAKDLKEAGIFTGLHYIPLHLLSYYKTKYGLKVNDFPVALANYQQILSLPLYAAMSDDDIEYVCETVKNIAKHHV